MVDHKTAKRRAARKSATKRRAVKRTATRRKPLSKIKRAVNAVHIKKRRMSTLVYNLLKKTKKVGYFSEMGSKDYKHMRDYLYKLEPWKSDKPLPEDVKTPADRKKFVEVIQKGDGYALEGWSVIAEPQKVFMNSLLTKERLEEVLVHELVHLLLKTDEELALSNHRVLLREEVLCDTAAEAYIKPKKVDKNRLIGISDYMRRCLEVKGVRTDYKWVKAKLCEIYTDAERARLFTEDFFQSKKKAT